MKTKFTLASQRNPVYSSYSDADIQNQYAGADNKRKAGDRYSGRSARDLPITYTSRHRSIKIRVMTPEDAPYSHAYHNEGFVSLYPAWLAPAGAVPLKTIVKSNDAVISD